MPTIILQFKDKVIDTIPIECGQTKTIGRKASNDIIIDNLAVSGNHARVDSVSATFILTDLHSTNGTFVNDKLVSTHHLRHQDVIIIGKHRLTFDASDLEKKLDEDLDQAEQDGRQPAGSDKTRYLDTSEYRELIRKARGDMLKK